jgi:hypothetical protein
LNLLVAQDFLHARDRARGGVPLADFIRVAYSHDNLNTSQTTLAQTKAALLAIEAALPIGSIDNSEIGGWRPDFAQNWRVLVINAEGSATLMRCCFVLEDAIVSDWIKEDVGHLRACLPDRWKAVAEASPSSLAIRAILLDRSLKYGKVDRKRFAKKQKKK